jgi:SSS family solute:Na+ symporter
MGTRTCRVSGTVASVVLWLVVRLHPAALAILALSSDAKTMAENLYRFVWSWLICVMVTVAVSFFTTPKAVSELHGLVYGLTEIPGGPTLPFYRQPLFWRRSWRPPSFF